MKVVIDGNKTKTARGNSVKELMEHISELFTKEEIIAMLTEIQSDIEENVLADDPNTLLLFLQSRESCVAIIQQKINLLMENKGNE